jgi:uncharacterized damage-inducible protein DinB
MDETPEKTLSELILYNNWANQQVLTACQELSPGELAAGIPGGYGSVFDTLRHIIEGEAFYVELLTGARPKPPFQWEAGPDFSAIKEYAAQVGGALIETIQRVRPADLVLEEDGGQIFQYQALAVFIQIINHGVEHRTNITTVLNNGQRKPPEVDGWGYLSTHPDRLGYVKK